MAESPSSATAVKRPLEDPSSPAGPTDQPEAKREKLEDSKDVVDIQQDNATAAAANGDNAVEPTANDSGAIKEEVKEEVMVDRTADAAPLPEVLDYKPAQQSQQVQQPVQAAQQHHTPSQDESQWIHVRSVITSAEAATVIGKGGENVSCIRRLSGAKCTVSDYSRGQVERVLTVSGAQDAVAKAFGLIIRTLNNEPMESPSTAQSKTYPLRLLIPHILIGSIIGKSGVRIREIQEASGARLNASDACLPLSTERSLVVLGVADAVHIATYYIAVTLVEQLSERFGGPQASAYATRSGGPAGVVPGGMQVVPYVPQPAGGQTGHPDSYKRHGTHPPANPGRGPPIAYPHHGTHGPQSYGAHQPHAHHPSQAYNTAGSPRAPHQLQTGYPQAHSQQPYGQAASQSHLSQQQYASQPASANPAAAMPGQPITQQIFIPNDMVGAIIGKGGAKINEIRQLSGSVIKINEPQDNSNERLVTVTGTQECNQMALYMLYSRLGEYKMTK